MNEKFKDLAGNTDFFSTYMQYVDLENQEAPAIYHRWTLASAIGALLGRQFYLPFGKSTVYPNQYIMLMGSPAARKGSAMNIGRDLLKRTGFARFSASRTSLERFLIDMRQTDISPNMGIIDIEELALDSPSESYIFAGEFVDFIGPNDILFINLLTNLWDNLPEYKHPKIQGKSVEVYKPTVNLFGGSTPQTFSIAFPPEVIGTGFASRLLLVHSEPTGKRIAWPSVSDELATEQIAVHLKDLRDKVKGEAIFKPKARALMASIYDNMVPVDDARFHFYQERRHTHLLKLSMVHAAADISTEVEERHVLRANTMLVTAEKMMPRALGEFGKSKYAIAANDVLQFLNKRTMPATAQDIWKAVGRNISKLSELQDVIANLKNGEKIRIAEMKGKRGYMTNYSEAPKWKDIYIDNDWLTPEERL